MMLVVLEGIIMCFVLLIICVVGIANGSEGMGRKVRAYENTNIQWRTTQREYMAADFGCKEVYP